MNNDSDDGKKFTGLAKLASAAMGTVRYIKNEPIIKFNKFLDQLMAAKLLQAYEVEEIRQAAKSENPIIAVKQMEEKLLDIEPNFLGLVRNRTGHVKS